MVLMILRCLPLKSNVLMMKTPSRFTYLNTGPASMESYGIEDSRSNRIMGPCLFESEAY